MAGWKRLFHDIAEGDGGGFSTKNTGDCAVLSHEELVQALDDVAGNEEAGVQAVLAAEARLLRAVVSQISSSARACKRGYRFPSAVPT